MEITVTFLKCLTKLTNYPVPTTSQTIARFLVMDVLFDSGE